MNNDSVDPTSSTAEEERENEWKREAKLMLNDNDFKLQNSLSGSLEDKLKQVELE
jgi:hypothetical protein